MSRDDYKTIKERLKKDDNIVRLLEHIGCSHITEEQGGGLITARLPERFNSRNNRSVQVRTEYMSCKIRSRQDFKGKRDIFNLISYIHHDKRGDDIRSDSLNSKKVICNLFGWSDLLGNNGVLLKKKKDYTAPLKALLSESGRKVNIKTNPILDENIMNQFYPYDKPIPYAGWIDEGISYETQVKYGIGFDLESKRVVFPLRNRFGSLVGVKGRIMYDDDDERKYMYLYKCQNRYEWFNFYLAIEHIIANKKVYIFEAEKSSMKAYEYGIYNTLAIGSSEISDEQIEILKRVGLDIEIILCYDKGIERDDILDQAESFKGRNVKYIFDNDDMLNDKSSPIDEGLEKWNYLLDNNVYTPEF